MNLPILTVVVPTRNRPASVRRLLQSLKSQSMPAETFEVVIVDDGSEPPLALPDVASGTAFSLRIVRRNNNHGAHASRHAGLAEASAMRVLFLDDDVELSSTLLEKHASAGDSFAIGPILYHPEASKTPYHRYQTKLYAAYDRAVLAQDKVAASEIYICNASGRTERFAAVFDGVDRIVGESAVAGDGFDEELLNLQLKHSNELAVYLRAAIALHIDTKSLDDARRERRDRGATECRLLLRVSSVRADFRSFATLTGATLTPRTLKPRLFWAAPRLFSAIADLCTFFGDRLPPQLVPRWICYPPMAIAFWEGMQSEAPSYSTLRAELLSSVGRP